MRGWLSFVVLFLTLSSQAWEPEFRFTFEGIGDNREFHNGLSQSRTILGTLATLEAAVREEGHSLHAGLNGLYEFGSPAGTLKPKPVLYYRYEDPRITFLFGSFPRKESVVFPLAMLSDTLLYFRPLIEGLLGAYRWKWGWQNAFADWTGRQSHITRESFMAGSSGEVTFKAWFFQNFLILNHLAHTTPRTPGQHIRDHLGFALMTGIRTGDKKPFSGYLKGGLLFSAYRERSVMDGFIAGNSLLCEAYGQYHQFAVKGTLHAGEKQHFAHGDPFYRFGNYLRTDAVWYFINHKNVKGRFNLSFHLVDGKQLDQSQQLSLVYILQN